MLQCIPGLYSRSGSKLNIRIHINDLFSMYIFMYKGIIWRFFYYCCTVNIDILRRSIFAKYLILQQHTPLVKKRDKILMTNPQKGSNKIPAVMGRYVFSLVYHKHTPSSE